MNLILLQKSDFIKSEKHKVRLTGRRQQHVLEIHKAKVGDELCVGLINDKVGKGKVVFLDKDSLELEVNLSKNPPEKLPVTLVLALPRPMMLKRIFATIATLGVPKLILLNSWRVEKSFWNSSLLKEEEMNEHLMLGLEQAGDTVMPEIMTRRYFSSFIKNELPQFIKKTAAFVAHPGVKAVCPYHIKKPVTLLIGPEGGFIDSEIEALVHCGVKPVNLGKRILRVETAVTALLSRLF